MKKLMIALAAITLGFAANAAQVTWSTGALYLPEADGSWGSVKASTTTAGTWSIICSIYADDAGAKGALVSGIGNLTANAVNGMGVMTAKTDDTLAATTTYWIDAIISYTSDSGVTQTLTTGAASFTTKASGAVTVNFQNKGTTLSANILSSDMKFTSAIPEPTSGLMLLLGVGLMALKRKRA